MVEQVPIASLLVDGRNDNLPPSTENLDSVKLNRLSPKLIVGTSISKPLEVVNKTFSNGFRLARTKNPFHQGSIDRTTDVRTLSNSVTDVNGFRFIEDLLD